MYLPFYYRCELCQREYARDEVRYLCPCCSQEYYSGIPLRGVLTAVLDASEIKRRFHRDDPDWELFSTVEAKFYPDYPLRPTPFFRVNALACSLGLSGLWIKNDGLQPSGSLKDRASFLVTAEAIRLQEKTLVTASTGNAACALAAVCAAAGKKAIIYVPATIPKAKWAQLKVYGAEVILVEGSYDDAYALSLEHTEKRGGLNRNTAYHPLTIEGKKTVGLEILQQNGWKTPDVIVVPVGDGVILAGVFKAFVDLRAAGLVERIPRLVAVQAQHSDAIHRYVASGIYSDAVSPITCADSISVKTPSNAHLARRAILESHGTSVTVSEEEILTSLVRLARTTGIFVEPASATTVAALPRLLKANQIGPEEQVVLLITGHGLKDIEAPMKYLSVQPLGSPCAEDHSEP